METAPPDMLQLRREALPDDWTAEKKEREMHVPEWLVTMIYKCLEKKPEQRFENGVELHEYLIINSSKAAKKSVESAVQPAAFVAGNDELIRERDELKSRLLKYEQQAQQKENELQELKAVVASGAHIARAEEPVSVYTENEPIERGVSKTAFVTLLILTIGLAAFAAYSFFRNSGTQTQQYSDSTQNKIDSIIKADSSYNAQVSAEEEKKVEERKDTPRAIADKPITPVPNEPPVNNTDSAKEKTEKPDQNEQKPEPRTSGKYTVISKAHFHNEPNESTVRKAFISHWNKASLTPLGETADFIYVEFTNHLGQTSKGWLRKADLKLIN
jgi:serine/threonine-protein kinase